MKRALIFGITGQTGSYLAELLLGKGYEVHGIIRRSSSFNTGRIDHIFDRLHLHFGDVTDAISVLTVIEKVNPDEIYNLAAQSHVAVSFEMPEYTGQTDGLGLLRILEAVKIQSKNIRIYQASTSEMFGSSPPPQNEKTPFYPRSPYGAAKVYAYWLAVNYREAYDIHVSNGILFNHESPRRGSTFVTKKIVEGLRNIQLGKQQDLRLGNLNAKRDWGHARDYANAMHMMLQQDKPDDYVIATGEQHTVREFIEESAPYFGMKIQWIPEDTGIRGGAYINGSSKNMIIVDPKYYRPTEVDSLCGDASKARDILGWKPKTTFKELVKEMCEHELSRQ